MNIEQIYSYMNLQQLPFWQLYQKNGITFSPVSNYSGENISEDASDEEKVKSAINFLGTIIALFPDNSLFQIKLRKSKQANQGSIFGPFEFTKNDIPVTSQQTNGLNGLGNSGALGFDRYIELERQKFNEQLAGIQERNALQTQMLIKDYQHKAELDRQKHDLDLQKKEIEAKEQSIAEKNSSLGKLGTILGKAFDIVLQKNLPVLMGLAGVPVSEAEVSSQTEHDDNSNQTENEYDNALDDLGELITDNLKTVDEIKAFKQKLKGVFENVQKQQQQTAN